MPPPRVDPVWSATQAREVETLMRDLSTVAHVRCEGAVLRYETKQASLFGDRVLPPDIEVMRLLRKLAELGRITIVAEADRVVLVLLRSGLQLAVRHDPQPLRPKAARS